MWKDWHVKEEETYQKWNDWPRIGKSIENGCCWNPTPNSKREWWRGRRRRVFRDRPRWPKGFRKVKAPDFLDFRHCEGLLVMCWKLLHCQEILMYTSAASWTTFSLCNYAGSKFLRNVEKTYKYRRPKFHRLTPAVIIWKLYSTDLLKVFQYYHVECLAHWSNKTACW